MRDGLFPGLGRVNSGHRCTKLRKLNLGRHNKRCFCCCGRSRVGGVITCTTGLGVRIVPRVSLPNRTSTLLTTCPRFTYGPHRFGPAYRGNVFSTTVYPKGRSTCSFVSGLFSRVYPLFADARFRVNKSRTSGKRGV